MIERGPPIGAHLGQPIPSYIVQKDGTHYDYARTVKTDSDGTFWLVDLAPDECVIAPGLIYRKRR